MVKLDNVITSLLISEEPHIASVTTVALPAASLIINGYY